MEFFFKMVACKLPEDVQQRLYKDYGWHCTRLKQYPNAYVQYDKSFEIDKDEDLYYKRGITYYKDTEIEKALNDAVNGLKKRYFHYNLNRLENDCLFNNNEYEREYAIISNKIPGFVGRKKHDLETDLKTEYTNYMTTIGEVGGPFLYDNKNMLHKVARKPPVKVTVQLPKWRELKMEGKCDVESYTPEKEKLTNIKDIVREKKGFKVFTQEYIGKASEDMVFLKSLCEDKTLFSCPLTNTKLKQSINVDYKKAWKYVKVLHASMPVYTLNNIQFGTKERLNNYRKANMYRLQDTSRRAAFNQLEEIKKLARGGNAALLMQYVEKVLGFYFQLKSDKIFPRKNDFINEISNIVALVNLNRLLLPRISPRDLDKAECRNVLLRMLDIPEFKVKLEAPANQFGDKSTYHDPDAPDYVYINYKNKIRELGKRAKISKNGMEKCVIYCETVRLHFDSMNLDDTRLFAGKILEEALECQSPIWTFLAYLTMAKCNILNTNYARSKFRLQNMLSVSEEQLRSKHISKIIRLAIKINDKLIGVVNEDEKDSD